MNIKTKLDTLFLIEDFYIIDFVGLTEGEDFEMSINNH